MDDIRVVPCRFRGRAATIRRLHLLLAPAAAVISPAAEGSKLVETVLLKELAALENMPLVRKGNRLSIMPVGKDEWEYILRIEG